MITVLKTRIWPWVNAPLGTADAGDGGIGTVFLSILQPPPPRFDQHALLCLPNKTLKAGIIGQKNRPPSD